MSSLRILNLFKLILCFITINSCFITIGRSQNVIEKKWVNESQKDWQKTQKDLHNIEINGGQLISTKANSKFTSTVKKYKIKRKANSITFKQNVAWDNWKEIPNVGTEDMDNAPVFIPVKNGDYWILAAQWEIDKYGPRRLSPKKWAKDPRPDTHRGYHAWHSIDMKKWKHYGPVSNYKSKWVTTAEYVDGKFYIYYDNPNDQDPHLVIDSDLRDGIMGENIGMVFSDPTDGSDCTILHDEDGLFHLIYENWDYNNPQTHQWDSPVGGHAISKDGIHDFEIQAPVIDKRTTATGKYGTYKHSSSKTPLKYEIHTPEQNAYGDWTSIKIGSQYYLFCDYDPVGKEIRIGKWTGDNINKEFSFIGELGMGHPDPTIGFAEGQFYLLQQHGEVDFVSPGPWGEGIEARVGVDKNNDGKIDNWTKWQKIQESYSQKESFVRIIDMKPASIDLSTLPKGYGFQFEYKTKKIKGQKVNVVMEKIEMKFNN